MKPIRATDEPYIPKGDAGFRSANDENDDPYNARSRHAEPIGQGLGLLR